MKLTHLTLVALSMSLTQASAATVQEAGFGFRYQAYTDGTPTGATTIGPKGYPGSEGDEASFTVTAIAMGEIDNGSRVVQLSDGSSGVEGADPTPQYAAIRGDLMKGEIGVATGVFSNGSSSGVMIGNDSEGLARSGGRASIEMRRRSA